MTRPARTPAVAPAAPAALAAPDVPAAPGVPDSPAAARDFRATGTARAVVAAATARAAAAAGAVRAAVPWAATGPRAATADAVLAVAFLAAMLVERVGAAPRIGTAMPVAVLLSAVAAGALAVRRRAPLAAYLAGSVALSAEALFVLASPVTPYANLVGLYSLGLYATRPRARCGPVIVLLGMAAYFAGPSGAYAGIPAGSLFLWLLAWALGYATARRQEERDTARLLIRRRVAAEERTRIARELHDLVGHTLNVMVVQAGAARLVLARDPEETRALLAGLEDTGRDALDELDRVLGLLRRTGPPPDGTGLQPGLADLPRLAARTGRAGVAVDLAVDAAARDLPRTLDVSAYRIVQEALTNTVKHARAGSAAVALRRTAGTLDIVVRDDGRGAAPGYAPGRGLLGIAERVAVFGGTLEHGGGEGGGFLLHVVLPVP
ncbi:sensor histidine kinase [Kitasatospora sp. NBC_01539]|uniref:sensor histidine kinase n=1 Tax=Kitasatospora sp. NBC_01539 TaxID=2903577 RepID=UPI0038601709